MNHPSVSVVIPAHNAAHFIGDALASVFGQSHAALEVFVVDDGSTDGTEEVLRRYPAARLISLAHSGVSVARNVGVDATRGDFIAFLDADDFWDSRKIELQLVRAEVEADAGIVMCRQSYQFDCEIPTWFGVPRDGVSEPGYMPSNWMLHRATWEKVGPFRPGMTHSEDTDWLARASDSGVRIAMVDVPLVVHRIHGANASGLASPVRAGVLRALRDSVKRKQEMGR